MNKKFEESEVLRNLKHYLPTQFPLKDFIHHNTLHAFDNYKFHKALQKASTIFGYKTYLSLDEYRQLLKKGKIDKKIVDSIIKEKKGTENEKKWQYKLTHKHFDANIDSRIGKFRNEWKRAHYFNISKYIHPILFRLIGSYLDQGIAVNSFPIKKHGFLQNVRELERNNPFSIIKGERAKKLLFSEAIKIKDLLQIIVGDETLFEHYLFDQQFEHPGWSGMVSVLEDDDSFLFRNRSVSLRELVHIELILEINALDQKFGDNWAPLSTHYSKSSFSLFSEPEESEFFEVLAIWQEAFELTYYDKVLNGLQITSNSDEEKSDEVTFQTIFCLDDRECSLRRYIEIADNKSNTYSTAGFFNVEFYFQPYGGKFYTKLCPASVTPKYLIKEESKRDKLKRDLYFSKQTHNLISGWIISQILGIWSALKLVQAIFRPRISAAMNHSFHHMGKDSTLKILNNDPKDKVGDLQIGFTYLEMADRIEGLLKGIGLTKDFAPLIYIIGHGASSANNPYYAGYDCGACSGKPGSVNARVAAFMANNDRVRDILHERGIDIPVNTQFLSGAQDTTRDEIEFYDESALTTENKTRHGINRITFSKALDLNAKERARRFVLIGNQKEIKKLHEKVKLRSVSLFEPRPEYNHATNAMCVIGRREMTKHLFLDRRSFLHSFDHRVDPEGRHLMNILMAIAPVCGGINLEYYFSRTDNQRLGSGTKLPHNVVGLISVANGADGDLRTGLPQQMVEIHDPIRLLVIIEHFQDIVLKAIQSNGSVYNWFYNEWINLIVLNPETKKYYRFKDGKFKLYIPNQQNIRSVSNLNDILETEHENIEPMILK